MGSALLRIGEGGRTAITPVRTAAVLHAPAASVSAPLGRRTDLDWLRVGAFGLLILFHVGLVYAPFDWHIHSRHTEGWLREGILITGPWRLTLTLPDLRRGAEADEPQARRRGRW